MTTAGAESGSTRQSYHRTPPGKRSGVIPQTLTYSVGNAPAAARKMLVQALDATDYAGTDYGPPPGPKRHGTERYKRRRAPVHGYGAVDRGPAGAGAVLGRPRRDLATS